MVRYGVWGVVLAACWLGGCANYKVVSAFAAETTAVTGSVRAEMQQLATLCEQQVAVLSAITEDDTDARLAACQVTQRAVQALQRETLVVMDLYAAALLGLAEDKNFDLSAAIKASTRRLGGLQDASGQDLVTKDQVGALNKVLGLLADALVQTQREAGIRALVAAGPELVGNARVLRTFFASGTAGQPSDHQRLVRLVGDTAASLDKALRAPAITAREPIRATEHRVALRKLQPAIAQRQDAGPDGVGPRMVAAIDAWIEAVPVFQREALDPQPRQLLERIRALRSRSAEAREAADAAF